MIEHVIHRLLLLLPPEVAHRTTIRALQLQGFVADWLNRWEAWLND